MRSLLVLVLLSGTALAVTPAELVAQPAQVRYADGTLRTKRPRLPAHRAVEKRLEQALGERPSDASLVALGLGFGGATVRLVPQKTGVVLDTTHEALAKATRTRILDGGERTTVKTQFVELRGRTDALPRGLGAQLFANQLSTARRLRVASLELGAAGGTYAGVSYVGHLVWPRFGYDGPLPSDMDSDAPTIRAFLDTPGGLERWSAAFERSPGTVHMSFDLSRDSESHRVWHDYARDHDVESTRRQAYE